MDTLKTPSLIQPPTDTSVQNVLLNFSLNTEQITQLGNELLEKSKQILDQVAAVPASEANFETVIKPLAQIEAYRSIFSASSYFPQYISTSSEVRKASADVTQNLEAFEIESRMRKDLYTSVQNAIKNIEISALSPEDQRFIEKLQLDFKRNGLDLADDKLEKLKEILKKISENSIKFSLAIAEDKTTVELTEAELEGVPKDFLEGLPKKKSETTGEEVFVVGMKPSEFTPILELCKNAETRRKINFAYGARCKDNVALLEDNIRLRDEAAHIVGFNNHSEFQLAVKMAKTPENVYKFLDDLKAKLTPLAHEELKTLLEYKKREVPDADKINAWDLEYYKAQWLKEKYNVDHDLIRKYFPMEYTVDKVFELFGEEFDLTFEKVTSDYPSWLPAADTNVDLIKVSDRSNKDIIGYFYIDLFPRDGKFTHAALFPLQFGSPSTQWANNQSQPSVGAMVCNFPKPTASKPSLLKHNDVVTFCHELGHVLHHICSKTHYSRFHGTNVEHDFVETPSQLMENWCWEPSVLKRLSKHHETGEPLPDDVINCLIGSKNAAAGLFWLRQLLFCYFDMEIHTKPDLKNLDTTALYDKIRQEVALVPNQAGTYQHATIGHFMGGYDAGYYGYLWSLVYATDIYYTIFKGSELGKGGRNFRENVLLKGGSIDSMELLKKALSREPSSTPFLKSLGIL